MRDRGYPGREQRHRRDVVDWVARESLNLFDVQVDGHDSADPGGAKQVGDQARRQWLADEVNLVLPGVRIPRDDGVIVLADANRAA